jgi:hypothetical protein
MGFLGFLAKKVEKSGFLTKSQFFKKKLGPDFEFKKVKKVSF